MQRIPIRRGRLGIAFKAHSAVARSGEQAAFCPTGGAGKRAAIFTFHSGWHGSLTYAWILTMSEIAAHRATLMAGLFHDIRYALRQLGRSPYFTASAILMLALGICATSTALRWIEGTMLRPVPGARDTSGLVSIMRGSWNISPSPPFSYPDYRDLRSANRTFSGMLAYHHEWATLTASDAPQRIYAAEVTGNYFEVLRIQPVLGRFFRPDEEAQLGGAPYVVLGYSLWKTRFGGDPAVLGKSIEIQHQPFTIIGVAPEKASSDACPRSARKSGRRSPPARRPAATTGMCCIARMPGSM